MRKNRLGISDLYVSEIGLGCMSLTEDQQTNTRIIHEAMEAGVNFFDTADLYEFGMNEESVGKAIEGNRQNIILASKGGNEWGEGIDGWRWNPSKNHLKSAVKDSLRRLNTDYLDLYQLHGGTIEDPIDETIEAFEELVKEGIIRYYGISSIRPNVIKAYLEKSNIVSIMMQYSLLDRRSEEWFNLIGQSNVSVIARGTVAKGLLTDKYERKLSSDGYMTYSEVELKNIINNLLNEADKMGLTLQQLALRFAIDHYPVAAAVAGASRLEQLKDNLSATELPALSEKESKVLQELTTKTGYTKHRD